MADNLLPLIPGQPDGSGDATMLVDIEHELRRSYLGYAVSTLISRALPDVRDGFKPVQRRILYAMRDLGVGPGAARVKSAKVVGECFVAGTLVSTPNGLASIETLNIGDEVYTQTGVRPVTQCYVMPPQPLLEVVMANGNKTVCTPGQQYKVLTSDLQIVWKAAVELEPGDQIVSRSVFQSETDAMPIASNVPLVCIGGKQIPLDADIAYMLGFFLADGWVDRDQLRGYDRLAFACRDRAILERVERVLSSRFASPANITEQSGLFVLRIHNSALNRDLLETFGLQNKYADNIVIPNAILKAPASIAWAFVSGYIDGDGFVDEHDNRLVLTSISEKFVRQMQILLHSLQIHSHYFCYPAKTGSVGTRVVNSGYPTHVLEVYRLSLERLAPHLSLAHPRKRMRLCRISDEGRFTDEQAQRIPYLGQKLIEEFRAKHLGGGWYLSADSQKSALWLEVRQWF